MNTYTIEKIDIIGGDGNAYIRQSKTSMGRSKFGQFSSQYERSDKKNTKEGTLVTAVVKANAYGHGAVESSKVF